MRDVQKTGDVTIVKKVIILLITSLLFGQFIVAIAGLNFAEENRIDDGIRSSNNSLSENTVEILDNMPRAFTENRGQLSNDDVRFYSQNGDFINKDISLTGGTSLTIYDDIDTQDLVNAISGQLDDLSTREIFDLVTREKVALIIETKSN